MAFVVDASVALRWHLPDEDDPVGRTLLDRALRERIVVPAHWQAEVANGALVGERRKRADITHTATLLALIDLLAIDVDDAGAREAVALILPLARATGLTVYDALYLELAERRGLPLATFDGELADAARKAGVEVLP